MKTIDAPTTGEPLLKAEEVSYRLRVSTRTLHRWCREGHIPMIKIGRTVFFSWSTITAHLVKQSTEEKRLVEISEIPVGPSEDVAMRHAAEEAPDAASIFQPPPGSDESTGELNAVESIAEADVKRPEGAKT